MADKLSLKWIDGNDLVAVPGTTTSVHIYGYTESPTFDVDNPNFWTPLSVLSGLASGFCERRAVLDPVFVVGTTTGGASITSDWTAGPAAKDSIVSNCMHNLALGKPVDSLYYTGSDATFYPIGSSATSNYMTTMDAAITMLLTGETHYVDLSGSDYASGALYFPVLASAAEATAAGQSDPTSAISSPVSNGGDLCAVMSPGLPVEWAKERKWMLDELRYTKGGASIDAGISAASILPGWYVSDTISGASTYSDAYETAVSSAIDVLSGTETLDEVTGEYTGFFTMSRHFDSDTIIISSATIITPYALQRDSNYSEIEDTNPICSVYIDAPYKEMGVGTSSDIPMATSRQDLAIKMANGARVIKLNYGTPASYVVTSGATVTLLPNLETVRVDSGELYSCVFSSASGDTPYESGTIITGATVAECMLNTAMVGTSNVEFNTAINGCVLNSGEITDVVASGTVVYYTLDSCSLSLPYSSVSSVLPLPDHGYVSGLSSYPFFVDGLTIHSGGTAKIAPHYVKGGAVNIYKGGTIIPVTDLGQEDGISITAGGPYTIPDGNTLIPPVFSRYLYENKPLIATGVYTYSSKQYSNPILLTGGTSAIGSSYTVKFDTNGSSWSGENRISLVIAGTNYTLANLKLFNSSFASAGVFAAPVIVAPGVTYELNDRIGSGFVTYNIVASGGSIVQTEKDDIGNGAATYMQALSGGIIYRQASLYELDRSLPLSITIRPGGSVVVLPESYKPSVLYLGHIDPEGGYVVTDPDKYFRAVTSDTVVSYTVTDEYNTTSTVYTNRCAWNSSGTVVWTDTYDPNRGDAVYASSNAATGAYVVGSTYIIDVDPFALYGGFGGAIGMTELVVYSGGEVITDATTLGAAGIQSGRMILPTGDYGVSYDVYHSCTLSGPSASAVVTSWTSGGSDVYYKTVFHQFAIYVNGTSVGTVNNVSSCGSDSMSFIQDGNNVRVENIEILGGTMTLTEPFVFADKFGYITYNPLALSSTGIEHGWNSGSGTLINSSYVYFGTTRTVGTSVTLDPDGLIAALPNATITSGGVSITGGGTTVDAGEAINADAAFIREGFSCYAVDVAAVNDHYSEFYVRQFPTNAEIRSATSSASAT